MTCFNPKLAYYNYTTLNRKKTAKKADGTKVQYFTGETYIGKAITFNTQKEWKGIGKGTMYIPCGKCLGCR